jgi:hypothetical protein
MLSRFQQNAPTGGAAIVPMRRQAVAPKPVIVAKAGSKRDG